MAGRGNFFAGGIRLFFSVGRWGVPGRAYRGPDEKKAMMDADADAAAIDNSVDQHVGGRLVPKEWRPQFPGMAELSKDPRIPMGFTVRKGGIAGTRLPYFAVVPDDENLPPEGFETEEEAIERACDLPVAPRP